MREIINEIFQFRNGGLLSEEEGEMALKILSHEKELTSEFTNQEMAQIYIDCTSRLNFAPEENDEWEIKLTNSIIKKIEAMLK